MSAASTPAVYPFDSMGKLPGMPLLVLVLVALAAGILVAFAASRYPTPLIGQEPSEAAAEIVAHEAAGGPGYGGCSRSGWIPGRRPASH